MAKDVIRCIKIDCRSADCSRAGRERILCPNGQQRSHRCISDDILWNFEKFLVGRDGLVIQRFSPDMTPEDPIVMESIKLALAK